MYLLRFLVQRVWMRPFNLYFLWTPRCYSEVPSILLVKFRFFFKWDFPTTCNVIALQKSKVSQLVTQDFEKSIFPRIWISVLGISVVNFPRYKKNQYCMMDDLNSLLLFPIVGVDIKVFCFSAYNVSRCGTLHDPINRKHSSNRITKCGKTVSLLFVVTVRKLWDNENCWDTFFLTFVDFSFRIAFEQRSASNSLISILDRRRLAQCKHSILPTFKEKPIFTLSETHRFLT